MSVSNPLQDPTFFQNPYPVFSALRNSSPVTKMPDREADPATW